jgi:hypothetical protein
MFIIFSSFKMVYNAHFYFCRNSVISVTITLNRFIDNWTYEQICFYVRKFVS